MQMTCYMRRGGAAHAHAYKNPTESNEGAMHVKLCKFYMKSFAPFRIVINADRFDLNKNRLRCLVCHLVRDFNSIDFDIQIGVSGFVTLISVAQ